MRQCIDNHFDPNSECYISFSVSNTFKIVKIYLGAVSEWSQLPPNHNDLKWSRSVSYLDSKSLKKFLIKQLWHIEKNIKYVIFLKIYFFVLFY